MTDNANHGYVHSARGSAPSRFYVNTVTAILLSLMFWLVGCSRTPQQQRDRAMRSAEKALKAHDLGRAIFFYRAAEKADPKYPEAHFQLGLAYLEVGSLRDAVKELKETADLDPNRFDAQLKLSEILALSRNSEMMQEAERRIRAVLNLNPGNADALGALALAEFGLGKQDQALEHLQASVEKAPQNIRPAISLAIIEIRKGNWTGAEAILKRSVDSSPRSVETAVSVGRFYFAFGKNNEAEAQFRRALTIDSQSGPALLALGETKLAQGNQQEAERVFAQLSALKERKYKPVHATFLAQQGRFDEAIDELARLYKDDPDDRATRGRLIGAYVLAQRTGDAEKLLSKIIAKNPKDVEALLQRAEFYIRDKKLGEAETDLNLIFRYEPESPNAHYLMASIFKARGAISNQKRELNEALRSDPRFLPARISLVQYYIGNQDPRSAVDLLDHAPDDQRVANMVQVTRIWALLAAGDLDEMGKSLDRALAVARNTDLLVQKGVYEARRNHWPEARAALAEVLEKDPENTRALDALAQTYVAQNQQAAGVQKIREQASRFSGSARLQHLLGEWLLATGDHAGARGALEKAKAADSKYAAADWALARLDLSEGKLDDSRKLLTGSIAKNASSIEARLLLAVVEDISGHVPQATEQYRKLLDMEPGNVIVLNNLAYLLADRGNQADEAEHFAKEAVNLTPDQSAMQDTLGWIYYRKGLLRESVTHLEKAVSLDGTPRRKYHLAMAYFRVGSTDKAQKTLRDAMAADPNLPEALAALQVQAESTGRAGRVSVRGQR